MAGMETELHLQADSTGSYPGYSANISGEGFADMKFNVESVSDYSFNTWLQSTSLKEDTLTMDAYHELAKPSIMESPMYYGRVDDTLFMDIMNSYMHHQNDTETEPHMEHEDHDMENM
jgi:cytochrome o ubiquinol oxidase subunit II